MLTPFFTEGEVRDFDEARRADRARYGRFFHEMLARGVYLPPSQLESAFVSLAHTPDDVDTIVAAVGASLESLERSR
jgi:glutamate-1-semialdehyde 2,1-aminomutase